MRTEPACLRNGSTSRVGISVVLPVLNEAAALPDTLAQLAAVTQLCEVLVVDGGSTDGTADVARAHGCTVLDSPPGRGNQLRCGAEAACGEVILLLHADTWLPPEAGAAVVRALQDERVVGGGFWKEFRDAPPLLRGAKLKCALRLWCGGRISGDQGIFVRREALAAIGGVPPLPLMEEFELCRRLRRVGRLVLADATVTTSARRFIRHGVLRTYARMLRVTLLYHAGVPPARLRVIYESD